MLPSARSFTESFFSSPWPQPLIHFPQTMATTFQKALTLYLCSHPFLPAGSNPREQVRGECPMSNQEASDAELLPSPEDFLLGFSQQLVSARQGQVQGTACVLQPSPPFLSSFCVDGWVERGRTGSVQCERGLSLGSLAVPEHPSSPWDLSTSSLLPFSRSCLFLSVIPGSSLGNLVPLAAPH